MSKRILRFSGISIKKFKVHCSENPTDIDKVNKNIVTSNKFLCRKESFNALLEWNMVKVPNFN